MNYREVVTVLEGLPGVVDVATRMFGISQRELARRAGISSASITRLLQGRDVTLSTALSLLRALDDLAKSR